MSHRHINVRENFAYSGENIAKILQVHPNPHILTKLDLNFCYWVSSLKLCTFVKQCKKLTELAVVHSSVSNQDLAEILAENENISKLSFSIESPETFWSEKNFVPNVWLRDTPQQNSTYSYSIDWDHLILSSNFGKSRKTFGQLKSLEIYMQQHPTILITLLRYI